MTTTQAPELTTYRWSSHDLANRFPVEDPATGEVHHRPGGGATEMNAAVEAAHRAFEIVHRLGIRRQLTQASVASDVGHPVSCNILA